MKPTIHQHNETRASEAIGITLAAMFFLFVAIPCLGAWTVAAWAYDGALKLFKKGHGNG